MRAGFLCVRPRQRTFHQTLSTAFSCIFYPSLTVRFTKFLIGNSYFRRYDGLALHFWIGGINRRRLRAQSAAARPRRHARRGWRRDVGRSVQRSACRACSISVSVSESRSAMICGQEPERPSAAIRSSSAFFSISARKLQNTWPRMVSSSLWKIGRVEKRCLAAACCKAWRRAD